MLTEVQDERQLEYSAMFVSMQKRLSLILEADDDPLGRYQDYSSFLVLLSTNSSAHTLQMLTVSVTNGCRSHCDKNSNVLGRIYDFSRFFLA